MAAGINIADRAAEKIKKLLRIEKREGQGVRKMGTRSLSFQSVWIS